MEILSRAHRLNGEVHEISYVTSWIMEDSNNECSICLETYNEKKNRPLVLPCSHSFCQGCLFKFEESNTKKCSICRSTWNNTNVKDLLCCIQLIPSASASGSKKDVVKCTEHDAEANSWCTTCDEAVCLRCLRLLKHKGCKWMLLEEKEYDAAVKKLADIVSKTDGTFKELDRLLEQLSLDRDAVTAWQKIAESLLTECPRVDGESGTDMPTSKLHEKTEALAELTANEPAMECAKLASLIPSNRQSISSLFRPPYNVTTKLEAFRFRPLRNFRRSRDAIQKLDLQNMSSSLRSAPPPSGRLFTIRPPDSLRRKPSSPTSPFRPCWNLKRSTTNSFSSFKRF